jgi:hypothetical protein
MRTAHSDTDRREAGREVQEVLLGHVVAVRRGPGCGRRRRRAKRRRRPCMRPSQGAA